MESEIKSWAKDIILKSNDNFDILHNDNELTLKKIKIDKPKESIFKKINILKKKNEKHIYIINAQLPKKPSDYIDLFWDTKKMQKLNNNIIKNIDVLEHNENYQKLYLLFGFKTKNISIDGMDRTEKLFLNKKNNQNFSIYGKIFNSCKEDEESPEDNILHLENGYSYLNLSEFNGGTKINYITEMELDLPKVFTKLPGILAVKIIKNLKEY